MIYFLIIVFITHIIHVAAGFGSTAIGIPFLTLFLGTEQSVALMSVGSLILSSVILVSQRRHINVREALIIILSIIPMMPLGFFIYAKIRSIEWILRVLIGITISLIAGYELWRINTSKERPEPTKWAIYMSFVAGAIVEGMFSMGGALINYYALNRIKDKSVFRATMVSVWVTTNSIALLYRVFVLNMYTRQIWFNLLYALPVIGIAFLIGNALHNKVSNDVFPTFVYSVQLLSGVISCVSGFLLFR